MEEYFNIINRRNSLPINIETYLIHSRLAEQLFHICMDKRQFDVADSIIEETMLFLPPDFHPLFTISGDKTAIHFTKSLLKYNRNRKYLSEALTRCPGDVYIEIDPFEFGTQLICHKNGNSKPLFITLDRNSEDDKEWYEYCRIKASYRKIKVRSN